MAPTPSDAMSWFKEKAKTAAGIRKNIIGNADRSRDITVPGKMFSFWYDPKLKAILPIYDRFPLVFPLEMYPDSMLGLNLHYLTIPERKYLIDQLIQVSGNKNITDKTKLKLSYAILSTSRRLDSLSRPCIKKYLFNHVQSKFTEILPSEWQYVTTLPIELFVRK